MLPIIAKLFYKSIALLVVSFNSIAMIVQMENKKPALEPWQVEDAARLKVIYENTPHGMSQSDFGQFHGIGTQGMVSQYLHARRPLNIKAADAFARGLHIKIEEFSPTIARQIMEASATAKSDNNEQSGDAINRPANSIEVNQSRFRQVPVIGKAMGGMPDRLWGDGDYPVGGSDCYAEIASQDPNAFLVPIEGESMSPRYNPGEYALVEPNTAPELEDDVLVKLGDGRIALKRLLSQRTAIRLGSYNSNEIVSAPPETIIWMYYVAHPVPARKIKQRT